MSWDSLLFANLTGVLGFLGITAIAARVQARKIPLMPTLFLCILVFVPVGCLVAETLLMAFGVIAPHQFWPVYLNTLRVSLPLSAVFGLGALVHALLRERLRATEEKLHEKEVSEERTKKLAAEARLSSLESRIHPHFLFNTLNSISSAIAVNPAKAEQIVGKLAVLLRAPRQQQSNLDSLARKSLQWSRVILKSKNRDLEKSCEVLPRCPTICAAPGYLPCPCRRWLRTP